MEQEQKITQHTINEEKRGGVKEEEKPRDVKVTCEEAFQQKDVNESCTHRRVKHVKSRVGSDGSRKDEDITDSEVEKAKERKPSSIAFTFRRLFDKDEKFQFSQIDIHTPDLRLLIKESLTHPSHIWDGVDGVALAINAPFEDILQHWSLLDAATNYVESDSPERKQARTDLRLLLQYIAAAPDLESYFKMRDAFVSSKSITFEWVWTLFPKGAKVVAFPFFNIPHIFKVYKHNRNDRTGNRNDRSGVARSSILCWCYDWNGHQLERTVISFNIESFSDLRAISSLPCYPVQFYENQESRDTLIQDLINTGRRYREIHSSTKDTQQIFSYNALAFSSGFGIIGHEDDTDIDDDEEGRNTLVSPKRYHIGGEIVIDPFCYLRYGPGVARIANKLPTSSYYECPCVECQDPNIKKWCQAFCGGSVTELPEEFIKEQYLLCPPRVLGYCIQQKLWAQFRTDKVENFSLGDTEKAFDDRLAIDDMNKRTIKSLIRNHGKKDVWGGESQVQDYIPGKGRGLVILLHGPPGVGKTFTAETIAFATGKPLISVGAADIGIKPEDVEGNLNTLFSIARYWKGILLIDEAEVFLTRRRSVLGEINIERNALVSVMLRVLEYFEGILILTTNRINDLDIAVQSRIQFAAKYNEFDSNQAKKVWNMYLEQLTDNNTEGRDEIKKWAHDQADRFYRATPESINGRQIRHIVSSAQAIAREENRKLKLDDIMQMHAATVQFKRDLWSQTDDERQAAEAGFTPFPRHR